MTPFMRLTILVENTALERRSLGEHGLAFWIEAGPKRVLFDTGQTPQVLVHNAERFGIDLAATDAVVLSHGHDDHTGGLEEVLRRTGDVPLFLHPGALTRRFSRKKDGSVHDIGAPHPLDEAFLGACTSSLVWTQEAAAVTHGLRVTGQVPRRTDFEDTGGDFYLDRGCAEVDPILDDQAIFFDTAEGTVVLLGCGHSGVVNTLYYVRELTGGRPVHAVIGGMHLNAASDARLDSTVEALRELEVGIIAPLHCTGPRAQARLALEFPDQWKPCHVGSSFEFSGGFAGPAEGRGHR